MAVSLCCYSRWVQVCTYHCSVQCMNRASSLLVKKSSGFRLHKSQASVATASCGIVCTGVAMPYWQRRRCWTCRQSVMGARVCLLQAWWFRSGGKLQEQRSDCSAAMVCRLEGRMTPKKSACRRACQSSSRASGTGICIQTNRGALTIARYPRLGVLAQSTSNICSSLTSVYT